MRSVTGQRLLVLFILLTMTLSVKSQSNSESEQVNVSEKSTAAEQLSGSAANQQKKAEKQAIKQEDLKKAVKIEDLAYGSILFDYYRGESIEALNGILVAEKKSLLPNHQKSARLLSGVIYLDLGMLGYAQKIFNALLSEEDLKSDFLARIEFYLGKLHYRQGDYTQASTRLARIINTVSQELKDEGLIMLSNIALSMDKKQVAREWLLKVSQDSKLAAMSRFNLGMMWLREGQLSSALPFLNKLYSKQLGDNKVVKSLEDKANVALGFFSLSQQLPEKARDYLLQVRLDSPSSNKALLGMGWSYAESGNYARALVHWLELSRRNIRDVAVQESLLAIPFAYQKLNSMQLALGKYQSASIIFQKQIVLIDDLMQKIENGEVIENFVNRLVKSKLEEINDRGIQDSRLFGKEYDYYLFELISQHRFNEGFRSYQKLTKLAKILIQWEEKLPMFSEMLLANKIRFEEKVPAVKQYLAKGAFDEYQSKLSLLESDIGALKRNEKIFLLASEEQLPVYRRVSSLEKKIIRIPDEMLDDNQKEKSRRVSGVLQWQLEENKMDKIRRLEKLAATIRSILKEVSSKKVSLANAKEKSKARFSGFQVKVDHGAQQLTGLRNKILEQIELLVIDLKLQIIQVLTERKLALDHYLLQSDLSIARLHELAIKIPELE